MNRKSRNFLFFLIVLNISQRMLPLNSIYSMAGILSSVVASTISSAVSHIPGGSLTIAVNNRFNGLPCKAILSLLALTTAYKTNFISDASLKLGKFFSFACIKSLFDKLAVRTSQYPLQTAVKLNQIGALDSLLKKNNGTIDAQDKNGMTALCMAIDVHNNDAAKALLRNGACPGATSVFKMSPLHFAADTNNVTIASILLGEQKINKKINLDVTNEVGETPLHRAIYKNNYEMVKLLIEKKADVNRINNNGQTPLSLCEGLCHELTNKKCACGLNNSDPGKETPIQMIKQALEEAGATREGSSVNEPYQMPESTKGWMRKELARCGINNMTFAQETN